MIPASVLDISPGTASWYFPGSEEHLRDRADSVVGAVRGAPSIRSLSPWRNSGSDDLLVGLAGNLVRTILPCTDADSRASLVQFLVGYRNWPGRQTRVSLDNRGRHFLDLFSAVAVESRWARIDHDVIAIRRASSSSARGSPTSSIISGQGGCLLWVGARRG